jgi:drug/metabolite transporter (DMT)-like permease
MSQTEPSPATPDRTTLIAFASFIILGGGATIAVRFTYGELAPFWSGTFRFGAAAMVLWVLVLIKRLPFPRGRALAGAVIFGVMTIGLAITLVYYGLTKTQASIQQTIVATMPLLTLFFAAAHGLEKLKLRGVIGGLLAVLGIALTLGASLSSGVEISLPHIGAILLSSVFFAEGGVLVKLFPHNHPFMTNAIAMTVGAAMLAVASLAAGETWALPSSVGVWMAWVYLFLGVTVGVWLLYLFVLNRWTASGTSFGFVLMPIVTVILAFFLTDETISPLFLAGAALVMISVYIGALMTPRKAAEPGEVALEPGGELSPELATTPAMDNIQARPGPPNCS